MNILQILKEGDIKYLDTEKPFPEPFRGDGSIKAIILGADPSNPDGNILHTVFDLNLQGKRDRRYFSAIEQNIGEIGLEYRNIYVQNVCRNYFEKVTYKHKSNWKKAAALWLPILKKELDGFFPRDIPVLATTEIILQILLKNKQDFRHVADYYSLKEPTPIPENQNHMGRDVFPFYRSLHYTLHKHPGYKEHLKKALGL